MLRFNSHRYQFFVGLAGIIGSLGIILYAVHGLQIERRKALYVPQSVVKGSHTWYIVNANNCVGHIDTSLSVVDDSLTYSLFGSLHVSVQNQLSELTTKGFVQFNSLDQVFSSLITLGSSQKQWQFGSTGVTPIEWSFKQLGKSEHSNHHRGIFPGPLSMNATQDDQFRISHPLFPLGKIFSSETPGMKLLQAVSLELREDSCESTQYAALALDPYLDLLKPLNERLQFFVR